MGGYIGARAGSLSTTTVANVQDVTATDTTPEVTIINNTHEDTDGGREGKVIFKGQQSGGEESTLAEIQGSHDGTADDQKGDLIFRTNDGSDGASPTEAMRIDSSQKVGIGGTPVEQLHINSTSGDARIGLNAPTGSDTEIKFFNNGSVDYTIGHDDGTDNFVIGTANVDTALVSVDKTGKVGIGETSPTAALHISTPSNARGLNLKNSANNSASQITFLSDDGTEDSFIRNQSSSSAVDILSLGTGGSERVRIDASENGQVLFGKTSNTITVAGTAISSTLGVRAVAAGSIAILVNRLTNDGELINFRQGSSTVGSIGSLSGTDLFIAGSRGAGLRFTDAEFFPVNASGQTSDNTIDLGHTVARFDDVFATNGTIQTSDENEKQNIAELTSAEITAATAISKLFKTFKWKSKVTAKGNDARTHTGVVAQQVQTAMSEAGLDASKYAFWCSDTWWEKDVEVAAVEADDTVDPPIEAKDAYTQTDTYETKDAAPEGATERTRLGIRYPELLAFIGAATEQRLTSIESRLTALEG